MRLRRAARWLLLAVVWSAAAAAADTAHCAAAAYPRAHFTDPNGAYRAFVKAATALSAGDGADHRAALYSPVRSLRSFSRELDSPARASLVAALDALEAQVCADGSGSPVDPAAVLRAAEAVERAVPRSWTKISARLRGRDQPGHPLRTRD